MTALRIVFMGTPGFAVPALDALIAAGHDIACAYTRPPRRAGRGQRERLSAVHEAANRHALPVRHPARLDDLADFAALAADIAVVAAYGLILPAALLEAPRFGCVNIHASLLPRWRGAAPIQRALLAGDDETGITVMQMDEGLDTGAILARRRLPIGPRDDAGAVHDALASMGAELLLETLAEIAGGRCRARPQPDRGVTYAAKIERGETAIDWREPAAAVDRRIRAFSPAPGAWFEARGTRVRVLAARPVPEIAAPPGTVVDDDGAIACGEGGLRLERLQRAGKGAVDARAFLRGFPLPDVLA
ncbi:MAG: methionyl-tRNA formyltransferase [Defluviicoccus sp.]|nr:methionyl-tRNA formyltransferase [Defluviicoccus sp.]